MKNKKLKNLELSVIIIARNEEKKLPDCLKSVSWADEILIFDDGSTDKTVEIAKKFGAFVFSIPSGNFSSRKNLAFSKAKNEWILSLDADERVTPMLRAEIDQTTKLPNDQTSAYAIPRRNIIFGREFKYGGQWPDYVIRLFKKNKFVRWEGELHEQPVIDGELGYLKNSLIHHKHDNHSEMVEKTNEWSGVEAKLMYDAKHPKMNLIRFFTAITREFWLRMVVQKSFLDGGEGVIYALYQVFSRFLSYAKLWEMQLEKFEARNPKQILNHKT